MAHVLPLHGGVGHLVLIEAVLLLVLLYTALVFPPAKTGP